jgi:hypothetical protein
MKQRSSDKRAREVDVPQFADSRGRLAAFERLRPLPFTPVRTFVISDVPPGEHRAQHVTRCSEFLWMAAGSCRAIVRPREKCGAEDEQQFRLTVHGRGLYIPQNVWIDLCDFTASGVLICVADAEYAGTCG